ncbi:MAG: sensor histidine kinase [Gemmatimonadales bacterium]
MASYPLRGLRVRLAVSVALSFLLLFAFAAAFLYTVLRGHWYEEVDQTLGHSQMAAAALFSSELAEYGTPQATVVHIVSELVFGDRTIIALDSVGTHLAQSRPIEDVPDLWHLDLGTLDTVPETIAAPNGPARVITTPLAKGYRLVIGLPLATVESRLRDLRIVLMTGGLFALVVGSAAALLVSARALRPVTAMADHADRAAASLARGEVPDEPIPPPEATATDEVGRLQAALAAMTSQLEAALIRERETAANQRRFFADAAHELRTPVAILRNQIETARLAGGEPDRNILDRLSTEAVHLSNLVGDLLLLARGETASEVTSTAPMFLDDVVSDAMVRAGRLPHARGRQISLGRFDSAKVRGDPTLIERALLALIENALLYAPESPVEVSLALLDTDRPMARIRVTDQGEPIPAADVERVFTRFVRLRKDTAGSGLGLAIVKRIAELHGGTIGLEQAPPRRSKSFYLDLPVAG